MSTPSPACQPLSLPCGARLSNRLAKAAMTERMTGRDGLPHQGHLALYRRWAEGGAGLMLTGNIMVDRRSLESAGNVIVEDERALPALTRWAQAGTSGGQHLWAQISHPGRQTSILVNASPRSASDVKLRKLGLFARPSPMSEGEIQSLLSRFAHTAALCQRAGFTGVQLHAAHGYLLNQFLSPRTNLRQDRWGGSLENRARLLLEAVRVVRQACGARFPVGVKLNSADFQRGGFDEEDSLQVMRMLEREGVDLLEISGGTYENVVFYDAAHAPQASTRAREAYFLDFAIRARSSIRMPMMLTGGFRTLHTINQVLARKETDVVGMAKPFLFYDRFPQAFLEGREEPPYQLRVRTGVSKLDDLAESGIYTLQIARLAQGLSPLPAASPWRGAAYILWHEAVKALGKRLGPPKTAAALSAGVEPKPG